MLKTVLETTEGLDEALIPLYTETDGKFILAIEGVDGHPDVANLKSAYERVKADRDVVKAERDTLKTQVGALPEDFDPEKWAKLKDGKADEAVKIALKAEYDTKIADLESKLTATQEAARKTAVERDLVQELTAVGVTNPAFAKAAQTMLSSGVQVGEDGKPFVDTDMGPLDLAQHVKRWAAGEGKDFVTAPKGGGSKGGDGGGTITAKEFAAMGDKERTELFRSDPDKFKELSST